MPEKLQLNRNQLSKFLGDDFKAIKAFEDLFGAGTVSEAHVADGSIHFTQQEIDHEDILNKGTNTHAEIDDHIADDDIHFEMLDEDDFASDSDTKTATQQSIKAYTDANDFWTRTGTTLSPKIAGDGVSIDAGFVANSLQGDYDFTINGEGTEAYKFDAGLDGHTWRASGGGNYNFQTSSGSTLDFTIENTVFSAPVISHIKNPSKDWSWNNNADGRLEFYSDALLMWDMTPSATAHFLRVNASRVEFNVADADLDFRINGTSGSAYEYTADDATHTFNGEAWQLYRGGNLIIDIQNSATNEAITLNAGALAINDGYDDLNFAVRARTSGNAVVYDAGTALWKFDQNTIYNDSFSDYDFTVNRQTSGEFIRFDAGTDEVQGDFIYMAASSVALGLDAGNRTWTGKYNAVFGQGSGAALTTGGNNFLSGKDVGKLITSGSYNVGIGQLVLEEVTTTSYNIAVGLGAQRRMKGTLNTAFGRGAMGGSSIVSNNTGQKNFAAGYETMAGLSDGDDNAGVGYRSLKALTTGSDNNAFGQQSGLSLTTTDNFIGLGAYSGKYETAGNKLFIDSLDRTDEATGRINSIIYGEMNTTRSSQNLYLNANVTVREGLTTYGTALFNSTGGDYDFTINSQTGTAYQYDAGTAKHTFDGGFVVTDAFKYLDADTGSSNCTFIGASAGDNNTAQGLTAIGIRAGENNTGVLNTYVGGLVAIGNTGRRNVAMGYETFASTTSENSVVIGVYAFRDHASGNNNVAIGYNAGRNNVIGSGNVFLGCDAGKSETGSDKLYIANSSTSTPLILGNFSTSELGVHGNFIANKGQADYDFTIEGNGKTAYKYDAGLDKHTISGGLLADAFSYLDADTGGTSNLAVGENSGNFGLMTGGFNTLIGKDVGMSLTSGASNVGVGVNAIPALNTGSNNVGLGTNALLQCNSGSGNFALGSNTLRGVTSAVNNVAIGNSACRFTAANANIGIGAGAMYTNVTGANNIAIGADTMNIGSAPTLNIAIGNTALKDNNSSQNVAIGYNTGRTVTGASNVLLGYNTASTQTAISNELWIANSATTTPLIWGNFSTPELGVYGNFIANYGAADYDFTIEGNGKTAYIYDAGLDTHTFDANVIVSDLTASKPVWSDANKKLVSRDITPADITSTRKTATTMTVTTGTLSSGTVTDTQTWGDGNSVDVTEVTGVPGFDVLFTFTSVTDFSNIGISAYYSGSATHRCEIQIYDDTNATWRILWTFSTGQGFNYRFSDIPVSMATRKADYINASDEVKIRFYHPVSGNASHDLYIDYVSLIA